MDTLKKIISGLVMSLLLLQQVPFLPGFIPRANAQTPPFAVCGEVTNAEIAGMSYPNVMWKKTSSKAVK